MNGVPPGDATQRSLDATRRGQVQGEQPVGRMPISFLRTDFAKGKLKAKGS